MIRLSICIPTHQGRGWCLRQALESIFADLREFARADQVEVCVSDNASEDDTQEVMREAAGRLPGRVHYHRFPLDVGPYNFLNAVRMASGEFCWFLGSDDILEPGAVAAVFDLLDRYPDCSGVTAHYRHFSFDMTEERPMHPRALYPDDFDREREIQTFPEALVQLSLAQSFMSVQLFRRALWQQVRDETPPEVIYYTKYHLHVYMLGAIMKRDPRWVWSPREIVRMRGDNGDVPARIGGVSYAHPLAFLQDMTSAWSRLCGTDRATYRRILGKLHRLNWSPQTVRHIKMLPHHRTRDEAAMAAHVTRLLWPVPAFWRGSLPALFVPHGFWKALFRSPAYTALKRRLRRPA